jgi:hypothetical protein
METAIIILFIIFIIQQVLIIWLGGRRISIRNWKIDIK